MSWMQTYGGGVFDFGALDPFEINPADIAASLGKLCRFNGHTKRFYSVAEHSILVSRELPPPLKLAGLLHDAHEAYTGDTIRPLKILLASAPLEALEERVQRLIFEALGLPFPDLEARNRIKEADIAVLLAEKRDVMNPCEREWVDLGVPASDQTCVGLPPREAYHAFLSEYRYLRGSL